MPFTGKQVASQHKEIVEALAVAQRKLAVAVRHTDLTINADYGRSVPKAHELIADAFEKLLDVQRRLDAILPGLARQLFASEQNAEAVKAS